MAIPFVVVGLGSLLALALLGRKKETTTPGGTWSPPPTGVMPPGSSAQDLQVPQFENDAIAECVEVRNGVQYWRETSLSGNYKVKDILWQHFASKKCLEVPENANSLPKPSHVLVMMNEDPARPILTAEATPAQENIMAAKNNGHLVSASITCILSDPVLKELAMSREPSVMAEIAKAGSVWAIYAVPNGVVLPGTTQPAVVPPTPTTPTTPTSPGTPPAGPTNVPAGTAPPPQAPGQELPGGITLPGGVSLPGGITIPSTMPSIPGVTPAPTTPAPSAPAPSVPGASAPPVNQYGATPPGTIPGDAPANQIALGGTPYTVKSGDTGSGLAKKYTGDSLRWRPEIVNVNQDIHMREFKDSKGFYQLDPWRGNIKLPLSWRVYREGVVTPSASVNPAAPTSVVPGASPEPSPVDLNSAYSQAEQAAKDIFGGGIAGLPEDADAAAYKAAFGVLRDGNSARAVALAVNPKGSPEAMEEAAEFFLPGGSVSTMLLARARVLRGGQAAEDAARGCSLFTIRAGDLPQGIAQYYTGDPKRFREIAKENPGMKVSHRKGNQYLEPWRGTIKLPLTWKAWEKPLPPAPSTK